MVKALQSIVKKEIKRKAKAKQISSKEILTFFGIDKWLLKVGWIDLRDKHDRVF